MIYPRPCTTCKVLKPAEAFRFENKAKGRRKARCGDCENARMRADRLVNGEQRRKSDREAYRRRAHDVYIVTLKRKFGLTDEQADCPASAFVCPEQTNKTRCCATCGACWSTTKNVAFLEH